MSIVEFRSDFEGGECGYCKGATSSLAHGMWAHRLTCQDYQVSEFLPALKFPRGTGRIVDGTSLDIHWIDH